ncbi:LEC14B homolog isoform X1 [Prunus avium]|uniref:LEC14B homolog n=1 Tax=Prunus avium TaxID=42229 RepID=A0A6P5RJ16_PRUAV|nr:LEC14B homolog isoform X1 [Prunus avium]XP_021800822.1 LEC14B homolog isoform X1 [Prunus avium]
MSYRTRFGKDTSACDSGNTAEGSGSSIGPNEVSNDFDHEIAQLTKHRSRPHQLLSQDMPGKSRLLVSTMKMLVGRESNHSGRGRFSSADGCHVLSRYLPINGPWGVDQSTSPAYVSQFSNDGLFFVAGFQGGHIRMYNVDKGWKVQKDILTKSLRWTITDTSLSPDQRYLVYASMTPIVNIVNVGSSMTGSVANVTEIHEGLDFSVDGDEDEFGIFSVRFSTDGRELVAASSDASIYVYDLQANKVNLRIPAHASDVNTVCFADETGHLIYSGSDDNLCKVWDRRCLITKGQAAGVLMGHLEGVTFLDSRGDGRYLISNGKDQTTKLWDIRKMSSRAMYSPGLRDHDWDYRWMEYPAHAKTLKHPNDQSLATYRGHGVLRTLIRCYFSPAYSTGQKYIYTGSSDHCVYIYDLVTGAQVARLNHHEGPVRDCSWHPLYPMLVSSSWDGTIARWEFPGDDQVPTLVRPRARRRRGYYNY